uniref:Putative polyprotein n=1 Tax=Ixodes ricinus TaxID=34613 RepID=A0A0K8RJC5_IXORI
MPASCRRLSTWGTTATTNLNRLLVLQKKAIRCIDNLDFCAHTALSFSKHKIFTIQQQYNFKLALLIYKEIKNSESSTLDIYPKKITTYNLRHELFLQERIRTNYGSQKSSFLIPEYLNKFSEVLDFINNCSSLRSFKKEIKEYIFTLSA